MTLSLFCFKILLGVIMKYLIVSDIHGSSDSSKKILELFNKNKCDMLMILGDILYHGPRNDLPESYNPKEVIKDLNSIKNKIIAIKGNCDAEVDEMVLDFKILDSFDGMINNINLHLEHGHHLDLKRYNNSKLVLFGHTHIPTIYNEDDVCLINPGSITLPKMNNPRSYGIWDNNNIKIYDLEDNILIDYKY